MTRLNRRQGLALAGGAVLAAALLLATSAGAGGGADGRKVIGEASANGFRVKVTARRAGPASRTRPRSGSPRSSAGTGSAGRSSSVRGETGCGEW